MKLLFFTYYLTIIISENNFINYVIHFIKVNKFSIFSSSLLYQSRWGIFINKFINVKELISECICFFLCKLSKNKIILSILIAKFYLNQKLTQFLWTSRWRTLSSAFRLPLIRNEYAIWLVNSFKSESLPNISSHLKCAASSFNMRRKLFLELTLDSSNKNKIIIFDSVFY